MSLLYKTWIKTYQIYIDNII